MAHKKGVGSSKKKHNKLVKKKWACFFLIPALFIKQHDSV